MRKQLWFDLAAGLAGGLLATRVMQSLMQQSGRMPPPLRPLPLKQDPAEFMVGQAERALHRPLPRALRKGTLRSLDWAYGALWPVALAALAGPLGLHARRTRFLGRRRSSLRRLFAAGAGLGAFVWAVGALGWLPATRLTPPVYKQPIGGTLSNLAGHLVYGTAAVLPLALSEIPQIRRVLS